MREDIKRVFDGIELSSESKDTIFNRCIEKKHVRNIRIRYAGQIAVAAIAAVVLVFGSGTVYAAVSLYQAYMDKMSEEEITERYEAVQIGTKDADSFSRQLSEEERTRLESLRLAYKAGERFPETGLTLIDSADRVENSDAVYYDYVACIFYLPEKALSDEQLLEIVDVWEKANYSLGVRNGETEQDKSGEEDILQDLQKEMSRYQQEVVVTDEQKVLNFVEGMLSIPLFCGNEGEFSLDNFEQKVTLYGETNKKYWVVLENDAEKYSIFFTTESTPDNLVVYSIHHFDREKASEAGNKVETDRNLLCSVALELPEYLSKYAGMDTAVVRKEIYGEHYLVLTDEAGNRYRIEINASDGTIGEFLTYEAGKYGDVDLSGEIIN